MASDQVVVEFRDRSGRLAACVALAELTMFWSDGQFVPDEAYDENRDLFRRLEAASRAFQTATGGERELDTLERAWRELNDRFEIREQGTGRVLEDVGLHLDGERASLRW
jgi:hypothetical protein